MATFIEKDPLTGVSSTVVTPEHWDKGMAVHYEQDVEPLLDHCKALRNDGLTDYGIKNDLWHYAYIPPVKILELRYKHGVDIYNRDHQKKLFQLLNTEYKGLKTTEKRHTVSD